MLARLTPRVSLSLRASILAVAVLSVAGAAPASAAVEVVTPADIGGSWFLADTRLGGEVELLAGPGAPPLGAGSAHMNTDCLNPPGCGLAKGQLFTDRFGTVLRDNSPNPDRPGGGVRLVDIEAISYWSYRSSASTNSPNQVVSLNFEVDFLGNDASFTTLVYEPVYNVPPGGIVPDTWQYWDAFDGGNARWWSTRLIPGACAFDCFVPWATILANNPNARILRNLGFNVGSGWAGVHLGAGDGLTLGVFGEGEVTFNFEPLTLVRIDVRPNNQQNQVNTNAQQLVPIAILGDVGFDPVAEVDVSSVRVRGAAPVATKFDTNDVNRDGFRDLTLYFRARSLGKPTAAECADPDARLVLTGFTLAGGAIAGDDRVKWSGPDCN